jgi:extradiol dioxygenase family protein
MSTPPKLQPFHLAIPVKDLEETRHFYSKTLNFKEGRSTNHWVDLDFFGHQLVLHLAEAKEEVSLNPVDGQQVPVPHFGVVLEWQQWHNFADHLKSEKVKFAIEPYLRFEGQVGEQATLFFYDPSGNALEFKAFKSPNQLFAK